MRSLIRQILVLVSVWAVAEVYVSGNATAQNRLLTIAGQDALENAGVEVEMIGDINGDGRPDVMITSANGNGGPSSGLVRIHSGADGAPIYTYHGAQSVDQFGYSIDGIGDANKDGTVDFIIGAPDAGPNDRGHAWVFSGDDGSVLHAIVGDDSNEDLGDSVSWVGDFDRDGFDDFLVSDPGHKVHIWRPGLMEVISGRDGSLLRSFEGSRNDLRLGHEAFSPGDLNKDSIPDIVTLVRGKAQVLSGHDGSLLYTVNGEFPSMGIANAASAGDVNGDGVQDLIVSNPFAYHPFWTDTWTYVKVASGLDGSAIHDIWGGWYTLYGFSVSGIGDVDGDGHDDFATGNPRARGLFGGTDDEYGMVAVFSGLSGSQIHTFNGLGSEDWLGYSLGGGGDFDLDGRPDLIIGAPGGSPVHSYSGYASIHSTNCTPTVVRDGGCPGTGGFEPTLSLSWCAYPDVYWEYRIDDALGGAFALLFVGSTPSSLPLGGGCTLALFPIEHAIGVQLHGSGAGAGHEDGYFLIPPGLSGVTVVMQAMIMDPGGAKGYSMTDGPVVEFP